jgi:hypothetical protein
MKDLEVKKRLDNILIHSKGKIIFNENEWDTLWEEIFNIYKQIKEKISEKFSVKGMTLIRAFKEVNADMPLTKKDFYLSYMELIKEGKIVKKSSKYKVKCKSCLVHKPNNEMMGMYCEECIFLKESVKRSERTRYITKRFSEDDEYE